MKEEEIDLQVQLFFKDDEGKKLLMRDTNEILRKDKSVGLFASGAQKKAAEAQAAKEYLGKKTEKAVDVVKAEYVTQMVGLKKHNHHTKVKVEKMIGDRQSLINSWTWQEQMDNASGNSYFVCLAIRQSTWEEPLPNKRDKCCECGRRYVAALRCQQCRKETCEECDPVVHFGVVKEGHYRYPIPEVEKEYRKGKRAFDIKLKEADKSILLVDLGHGADDAKRRELEREMNMIQGTSADDDHMESDESTDEDEDEDDDSDSETGSDEDEEGGESGDEGDDD